MLLAQGHLIIQCENGDLALARAQPNAHELIARLPALNGRTWTNPALAGGRLYVRNDSSMICFDLNSGSGPGELIARAGSMENLIVLLAAFLLMNGIGLLGVGLANRG